MPFLHDPVDLCQLTAETCQDFSVSAPEHPVSVDLPDAPLFVTGDADRLRQVLANLMSNAVLHTPTMTAIRVSKTRVSNGSSAGMGR